jgi:hypothetical protein
MEVRDAWVAKQNAEQELEEVKRIIRKTAMIVEEKSSIAENKNLKVDWKKLGFPNFSEDIPPKEDFDTFLPHILAPGYYFEVAYSEIIQILGPEEMLISWKPIPSNTTMKSRIIRIKGYSTKGLTDGVKWPNVISKDSEIAIIGTWAYTTTAGGRKTVLTAIPLDFIRKGLTEAEFEQLLK